MRPAFARTRPLIAVVPIEQETVWVGTNPRPSKAFRAVRLRGFNWDSPESLSVYFRPFYGVTTICSSFSKAGVVLSGLTPVERVPPDLLGLADQQRSARLMAAVDAVNGALGRDTLVSAATLGRGWRMRQNNRSPAYTTRLADAPVIRA